MCREQVADLSENLRSERYEHLRSMLRHHRISAGLTQAELAARLEKPQSFVGKIETGERHIGVFDLIDWCRATGVSTQTVLQHID